MNDTLKVASRIGAELGAAKAENDRLRELLSVCRPILREYGYWRLVERLEAALSQQAEPACVACEGNPTACNNPCALCGKQPEPTDTFTAVDMATAAAQGFRDGQAAVEQAPEPRDKRVRPSYLDQAVIDRVAESSALHLEEIGRRLAEQATAQDEWEAFEAWFKTLEAGLSFDAIYVLCMTKDIYWQGWQARAARPEHAEQQPVAIANKGEHAFWVKWTDEGRSLRGPGIKLYAAPIAQTAPQPEQSGWVSAAERVPAENDGEVLVLMADGTCEIACASYWLGAHTDFAGWTFRDPDEGRTPTHWMPLPALSAQGQSNGDS